ncbi:MAG: hypothetical protein AAB372_01585 [Patescibacteria group bacterium]
MIYLLYGEETKRSLGMLRDFERRFQAEVPVGGWQRFDFKDEMDQERFLLGAGSQALFSQKDFYIIRNPSHASPRSARTLEELLPHWAGKDSIVVFFEEGVPEKNETFNFLKRTASKSQEFSKPSSAQAKTWMEGELKRRSAVLSEDQKRSLLARYGGDLWALESELDRALAGGSPVSLKLTVDERELFSLGDLWGRRERAQTVLKYDILLRSGFPSERMLWTMMWHIKSLFAVATGQTKGMNPYVLRKSTDQMRNFSQDELSDAYKALVELDVDEKRGERSLEIGMLHFFLTR